MKITHWIIVASFIAPLFACSASEDDGTAGAAGATGGTGGGTGGGVSSACGLTTSDAACDGCFQVACESQCVGAMQDPGLNDYLTCLQGCVDQTCADGCDTQYPGSATAFNALSDCMEAQCATECGGSATNCGLTTSNAGCDNCFQSACETECVAATDDTTLTDYLACFQACSDDACTAACDTQYPSAATALDALSACMEAQCASACGGGVGGCTLTTSDATCDGCFQDKCLTECEAASEAWDADYQACSQACTDQACQDACDTQFPETAAGLDALMTCMEAQCATECG